MKIRKIPKYSPDSVLDVFEAVKRALIHRGIFREKPKNPFSAPRRAPKKLAEAAVESHEILFKADTVFPFTLFPDTVTLDREKVSFATRFFFRVAKVTSIPVRDLLSVEADVGLFFGSVHTSSRYFITNPRTVNWLWREDAEKLMRLLQGYIIAHEQKMDCSHIPNDRLIKLLLDLGKSRTD